MLSPVKTLLSLSSEVLVSHVPNLAQMRTFLGPWNDLGRELTEILQIHNGFWAYQSSLLVRPFQNRMAPLGLIEWNEDKLWKHAYADELNHVLFFAEDAFGSQYCLAQDKVSCFEPETGQFEEMASSLKQWAQMITEDSDFRTGYPLAHDWQDQNEPLRPGSRLLPKVPFVLGGPYEVANLWMSNDVEGMLSRASIANQIRDVPDGGQITLDVVNKGK